MSVVNAAIRRPECFAAIGVFETSMGWAPWWPREHRDNLRRLLADKERKPATPERLRARSRFLFEARQTLSKPFALEKLTTPCVVGVGTDTFDGFLQGMRGLSEHVGAQLYVIPGAGHMAHREDPRRFAEFVREVIRAAGAVETDPGICA